MICVMASACCTLPNPCLCSSLYTKSSTCAPSAAVVLQPRTPNFRLCPLVPQLGLSNFSSWSGLRHMGITIRQKSVRIEKKGRYKGKGVYASLFGVGAPEALVIGVVALLVFGPKGLAEVARNLGKTLRAFQPTIRELQEVSREFKSTLEQEIGLNDIRSSTLSTYNSSNTKTTSTPSVSGTEDSQTVLDQNGAASPNRAYSTEEYLQITEELKESAVKQTGQTPLSEKQFESQTQPQGTVKEATTATSSPPQKRSDSDSDGT
ncbi:sec-independent protein translocase protein TATB, chloroplastic [Malania oleifera]|uniref:sec-independent protein translocase protein TATB, chloroplastic n=1 Tax=Malania oleifera TaxID=397392 RepID=UPI0025AE5B19|nr:sec-independent protein translocase protein TATB, chloroplastic [Malania oleifera]